MPQRRKIKELSVLSIPKLGDFIGRRIQIVVSKAMTWHADSPDKKWVVYPSLIDDVIFLQNYLFGNVPPILFPKLVSEILATMTNLSKLMKSKYTHENALADLMREGQLLVEYTRLVLHPSVINLDLNDLPNAVKQFIKVDPLMSFT